MIHIACAADDHYAAHCAVMLHSALTQHCPGEISIHFMHGIGLPGHVRERLQAMVRLFKAQITFHLVADSKIAGLPVMARIPQLMWYRVLLPELLPDLDRVLYLDADTLVMDRLDELWTTDLTACYVGAVHNVLEPEYSHRPQQLGLDNAVRYFNSGVLLLNLADMRRDNCTQRIFEYARHHGESLIWPDQDALNVVLASRRRELHPRWNCQNSLYFFSYSRDVFGARQVNEAMRNPGILHFEGPGLNKPWHYLCKHPYRDRYYRHLAQTSWPILPPEGYSWGKRFLRLLPMRFIPMVILAWRRLRLKVHLAMVRFQA